MIEITVTGFKNQIAEFEQPNQALMFLYNLREEHTRFIRTLIGPIERIKVEDDAIYRSVVCCEAKKHPLKVSIVEYDVSGLI